MTVDDQEWNRLKALSREKHEDRLKELEAEIVRLRDLIRVAYYTREGSRVDFLDSDVYMDMVGLTAKRKRQ
jgi:hypothetical protein